MDINTLATDVESLEGITNATPMMAGMHNEETDLVVEWDPNTILDSEVVDYLDSHEETDGRAVELTQADDDGLVITI